MPSAEALTAERFAEMVRPAINRVQRGVRDRVLAAGGADLPRRYGLPHAGLVDQLRFVLPRGPLPRQDFALAARYEPVETVAAQVDELVAGGWLVESGDRLAPGRRTVAYLDELYDLHAAATAPWRTEDLAPLLELTASLLASGTATGGRAYSVFTPPYERPGGPAGVALHNRLAALRYHRSDAHAAAWAARGLTAEQIVAMPDDNPLRREIEADTNRRSAPPYEALTPDERLQFLAGLAALP
jgi:hypothetical protein